MGCLWLSEWGICVTVSQADGVLAALEPDSAYHTKHGTSAQSTETNDEPSVDPGSYNTGAHPQPPYPSPPLRPFAGGGGGSTQPCTQYTCLVRIPWGYTIYVHVYRENVCIYLCSVHKVLPCSKFVEVAKQGAKKPGGKEQMYRPETNLLRTCI